jgi:hypothetical protein
MSALKRSMSGLDEVDAQPARSAARQIARVLFMPTSWHAGACIPGKKNAEGGEKKKKKWNPFASFAALSRLLRPYF